MQMREAEYWRGFSNARDAPMTGWKPVDYYSAPPSTAAAVMENWVDFSWILPINELRDKWESRVFFTCCSHRIGDTEWQNSMMQLLVAPAPYTIVSDPSSAGDETANMVQGLKTDRWRLCGKTKEKLLLYPTCIVMEQPKTDTTQLSKDACAGNGRGHNYLSHFMTVKIATFIRSYFHQLLCVIHDRLAIV